MEKKRIEYLDAIKGFAIFLMVMGHAIAGITQILMKFVSIISINQ